jgi:hypothetical protein
MESANYNTLMKEGDRMHREVRLLGSRSGKAMAPLLGVLAALALVVAGAAIYFLINKGEQLQAVQRDLQ